MLHERKKILIHRVIWITVLFLGINVSSIIFYSPEKNAEIIDDNCYITDYYEALDSTSCDMEITCNGDVSSAYVTVAFYDINGDLLNQEKKYFFGYGETVSATFNIDGQVDSYEIVDYDIKLYNNTYDYLMLLIFINFFALIFFIGSLLLSYKKYVYHGNIIIVYAGFYHHYISVNGIKVDEHNTIITWSPIILSSTTDDNAQLNATISLTNRISLKINNQLYNETR